MSDFEVNETGTHAVLIDKDAELQRVSKENAALRELVKTQHAIISEEATVDKEWLEYQFFVALHNLEDVAPDHYLVTTIKAALESRTAHLKRQAD